MSEPRRRLRIGLPVCIALALFAALAAYFDFLVDDAFISFRYGHNLALGRGLVFNPGESPPVEGFSNFLWVVYCAGLERLHLDPALWSRIASIACGAYLIVLLARTIAARIAGDSMLVLLASAFFATLPPIALWATGGLETLPFALAVFGVFERLLGRRGQPHGSQAGIWAAIACLMRADGCVWVAIVLAATFIAARRELDRTLEREVKMALVLAATTTLAYVAFRWAYYHTLEPNTARAKVHLGALSLQRGACYVLSLLLCVVSIPIALIGGAVRTKREPSGLAVPSLIIVLASFAYLILVGGDWMMMYRMLVPALAFVALLFAVWLASVRVSGTRIALGVICIALSILPAFDLHVVPERVREIAHFRWSQAFRSEYAVWKKGVEDISDWIETGKAIALFTAPGESMVRGDIGAVGYYAPDLVILDTHGLTNREPFLPVDPAAREMPGHDRKIAVDAFEKYRPTYFISKIVDADAPFATTPAKWHDPTSDAWNKYELIVKPLPPAHGFRSDKALLLVKYKR